MVGFFVAYLTGRTRPPGRSLPVGFPCGGHRGFPRLRFRTDPGLDLEGPVLGCDLQARLRRPDLRPAHRRNVWMALAEVSVLASRAIVPLEAQPPLSREQARHLGH